MIGRGNPAPAVTPMLTFGQFASVMLLVVVVAMLIAVVAVHLENSRNKR